MRKQRVIISRASGSCSSKARMRLFAARRTTNHGIMFDMLKPTEARERSARELADATRDALNQYPGQVVQAFDTFRDDTLRPTWVPLIRFDSCETNDGADSFDEVALNLGYYFNQNIKGYLEYGDLIYRRAVRSDLVFRGRH